MTNAEIFIRGDTIHCEEIQNVKISTKDDAAAIVAAIHQVENLVTLDLNGISLGVEGAQAVIEKNPIIDLNMKDFIKGSK